jgi:hypothetical protein
MPKCGAKTLKAFAPFCFATKRPQIADIEKISVENQEEGHLLILGRRLGTQE